MDRNDDAFERLRGRVLAVEAVVTILLGDYVSRNPAMAALLAPILQDLAGNRLAAEMLSDSELAGFREAIEDFVKRVRVEGHSAPLRDPNP